MTSSSARLNVQRPCTETAMSEVMSEASGSGGEEDFYAPTFQEPPASAAARATR